MNRFRSEFLNDWLVDPNRKPLIVRGARQVGKTWLVRALAKTNDRTLVELNFEKQPGLAGNFSSNDPARILSELQADLGRDIDPGRAILFLDEIQAAPALLASLRWFYEEMPELPVIAAGSLLDFTLKKHDFSMPVGRVMYCHVGPLTFFEFLDASGNKNLGKALRTAAAEGVLSPRLHARALELFSEYCLTGGLPEVVAAWTADRNDNRRLQLQQDLITSYRDDFNKYRKHVSADLLRRVLDAVPKQTGGNFVYQQVDADSSHLNLKLALEMLVLARVCHRIEHTAANGLPLGAEGNLRLFKVMMIDIGISTAQLGLSRVDFRNLDEVVWASKGRMAEQFVGQHLLNLFSPWEEPRLFYWQRTGGRQGEIDFILQQGPHIVPIEVNAGSAGSMKSLHAFMHSKRLPLAIRLDTNPPSLQDMDVRTTTGDRTRYRLLSLPLYMTEAIPLAMEAFRPA